MYRFWGRARYPVVRLRRGKDDDLPHLANPQGKAMCHAPKKLIYG